MNYIVHILNRSNKFFISKAKTLIELKDKIKKSHILDIVNFNKKEWINNKSNILNNIQKKFSKKVIIRSSALDEDKTTHSQAGKYLSLIGINPLNKKLLEISINKIFKNYNSKSQLNEVFIQPVLKNVSASGVIFTYDNEQGTPYYSIEYDDLTGKTDTVTAGKNDKSRTLHVLSKVTRLRSVRFKNLIKAGKEIEQITNFPKLDIEFGIDKKNQIFIFQVRPLAIRKLVDRKTDKIINQQIQKLEKNFLRNNRDKKFGKKNIFGVMPDWNPAEIIGLFPKPLAFSFYEDIITKKIWAESRKSLGYKDLTNYKLMENFVSHPYINTNLSFQSFLPKKISTKISKKIVNFWIDDLEKNNFKHDKIEFDVCDTCFNFSTGQNLKRLKKVLSKTELKNYRKNLISLTRNIIYSNKKIIQKSKKDLKQLEFFREKFNQTNNKNSRQIPRLVNNIKKLGTFNFANLARLAFISESFLRSLVSREIFTLNRVNDFKNSIGTVLTELVNDTYKLLKKKISWKTFCSIYGHLRSGTYDIESIRYDQSRYFDIKRLGTVKVNKYQKNFIIKNIEAKKIDLELKKLRFNLKSTDLLDLIKENIILREYSKFIFTKSVSDILEHIFKKAKRFNLSREDISFVALKDTQLLDNLKNKAKITKIINKNKKKYHLNKLIKLPYLITDANDFSIVPLLKGVPNYITSKKIIAKCLHIKNKNIIKLNSLKNKII